MTHKEKSFSRERRDATNKSRSVAAIQNALQDMDLMLIALDRYIRAVERRTRIDDMMHPAYSTAATAARVRSDNLKRSVIILKAKLRVATAEHESALAKLTALEESRFVASNVQDEAQQHSV